MEYEINREDLTPQMGELVDIIGLDNTIKLVKERGGENLYIPSLKKVTSTKRDNLIRSEFTGSNHKELARKYKLSIVWIRKVVDNT